MHQGDADGALEDYTSAIRLQPGDGDAFYARAAIWEDKAEYRAAIADLQAYLRAAGGVDDARRAEVEEKIRALSAKI